MKDMWEGYFDNVDWDAVERDSKLTDKDKKEIDLERFLDKDERDYKRSYIRKFRNDHPEILDIATVDLVTEQMHESHECGVELSSDDALRFVLRRRNKSVDELVKMLTDAGINDGNIGDVLDTMLSPDFLDDGKCGTVKNPAAKKKAYWLERWAKMLAKNPDVLILGLPTFDPESNYSVSKVAFFSENLSSADKTALEMMRQNCDESTLVESDGVAVVAFIVDNLWSDFK